LEHLSSSDALAIRVNLEANQRTLDALRWGLIPPWAKDPKIAYKTINARVGTVDTAPSYRQDRLDRYMPDWIDSPFEEDRHHECGQSLIGLRTLILRVTDPGWKQKSS
jgi:hypothetical protein